ncbi:MAG: hydroxymethylpyrimidine kinase/phosphomethylpyrimidine kinase/thiamine-phosphate diphosphorylase [Bermanella sp.]|jgi:hydroxymethylpyrimidine kinase/phosphomethylpyrimidine kinase/thiamine-phosphate diphosphorylase
MASQSKPIVWSIAGSDSGGGAGIQADLATFQDFAVHGCTVITAITAQNSFAVGYVAVTPRRALAAQINALDSDLPANAIKLGMMASEEVVEMVIKYLSDYKGFVVCDPVIRASSGDSLLSGEAAQLVRERLLPRVDLLTPNRSEAEVLLGRQLRGLDDVEQAAKDIVELGARSVLITGGHFPSLNSERLDYWTDGERGFWLNGRNVETVNSHGSGCTLSAAIAAAVARGYALPDALVLAKAYVTQGLRLSSQIGGGPGSVAHMGWPTHWLDLPSVNQNLLQQAEEPFPDCGGDLGLYPVVDSAAWVERLLKLGVTTIQLRVKDKSGDELKTEVERAVAASRVCGARLFINDYWQEAIAAGAYGVHLGQGDLPTADIGAIRNAGLRLGVSTHSYFEIATAHNVKPSYIALGPIFSTTSKVMPFSPQGVGQLAKWVAMLGEQYTLTAIGGIDVRRARDVLATGVGSCAMISAITESNDVEATVAELLDLHKQLGGAQ